MTYAPSPSRTLTVAPGDNDAAPLNPLVFIKDVSSTVDYTVDWTQWLADIGDTVASVAFANIPPALTASNQQAIGGVASVFLAGGLAGYRYTVECQITTTGGRTEERSIVLRCVATR